VTAPTLYFSLKELQGRAGLMRLAGRKGVLFHTAGNNSGVWKIHLLQFLNR